MRCFWYWLDPRGCTLNSHGITVGTFGKPHLWKGRASSGSSLNIMGLEFPDPYLLIGLSNLRRFNRNSLHWLLGVGVVLLHLWHGFGLGCIVGNTTSLEIGKNILKIKLVRWCKCDVLIHQLSFSVGSPAATLLRCVSSEHGKMEWNLSCIYITLGYQNHLTLSKQFQIPLWRLLAKQCW